MGIGGISIWQLLIILVIVVLLFGTKKLRNLGSDLGSTIKNFRSSMKEGEADVQQPPDKVTQQPGQSAPASGEENKQPTGSTRK